MYITEKLEAFDTLRRELFHMKFPCRRYPKEAEVLIKVLAAPAH